jgi:hypothetical protein
MSQTDYIKVTIDDFTGIRGKGITGSIEEIRSLFLQRASELFPAVTDYLTSELLELYKQIPLFYFEADEQRLAKLGEKNRIVWHIYNRPPWEVIESAWINRSHNHQFQIDFDDYYIIHGKSGDLIYPISKMPPFIDYKITQFVEKMFDWSKINNLNESWCREFVYETLDLWCQNPEYRQARIWQSLPYKFSNLLKPVKLVVVNFPTLIVEFQEFYPKEKLIKEISKKISDLFENQPDKYINTLGFGGENEILVEILRKNKQVHFDWLISYQVKGMNYGEIIAEQEIENNSGERTYLSDDTKKLRKAIIDSAELLGLTLRPEGRVKGRRSKKKNPSN